MTSTEILTSIQNWEAVREDSAVMNGLFEKGNCFAYDLPVYAQTSELLHAYPGIYDNKLYFFVIPAEYDKEEYNNYIDKYTEACELVTIVGNGDSRLTPEQALARMKAWENNYPAWVNAQPGSKYGIFEAFTIPREDCEVENVIMTLALKLNASAAGGFEADIVVTNGEGKQVVYDDYAKPVPPFSALPSQNDFYLLSANI